MRVLERIYQSYNTEDKESNPFETDKQDGLFYSFHEKYIDESGKSLDEQNTMSEAFIEVLMCERKTAFKIGFKACMELMLDVRGGVNNAV